MLFRPLATDDFEMVHAAFLEAFGDYEVPFQISAEDFAEMLRRRGYEPAASVGVFDTDRLVAFTLNGLGDWNGRRTGYDTGTGVVPSHRGRGISRQMIDAACSLLRARGAEQYLLEVLQSNERAFAVYRDAGFEVTRELQCWSVGPASGPTIAAAVDSVAFDLVASFFDVMPSWQNSIESVGRATMPKTLFAVEKGDRLIGCAVVFENGDLPFLAVEASARRRGVGTALLTAAANGRSLRLVNVDASLASANSFLDRSGAKKTVAQFEMLRRL